MLKTIRTMLRTRLALLAAFAVLALLIALFVAWGRHSAETLMPSWP
jgi:hypothetical protein